jgi:cytochrome c-type biogenesis protein CcmE
MKTRSLIALGILAVFMAVLMVDLLGSASQFADFETAREADRPVHVIGRWVKRDQAVFDAVNSFNRFYVEDTLKNVREVHYYQPLTGDLAQADKIDLVVRYNAEKNVFVAEKIHLKCPSKYNEAGGPPNHANTGTY